MVALGLPWSPFAILLLSRSVRDGWKADGRSWLNGWLQVSLACLDRWNARAGSQPGDAGGRAGRPARGYSGLSGISLVSDPRTVPRAARSSSSSGACLGSG